MFSALVFVRINNMFGFHWLHLPFILVNESFGLVEPEMVVVVATVVMVADAYVIRLIFLGPRPPTFYISFGLILIKHENYYINSSH